jgi:hypothetical protein
VIWGLVRGDGAEVIDSDLEWKTWREWLGTDSTGQTISAEVVEMLSFRKIWLGFAMIHDAAPEQARKNATFVLWLRWNYARSMGSAIRRQTDVRDDVVSLGRLIDRVWRYPTVLTRTRFADMQGIDDADMVNGWFDDLAGKGDYINPEIPAQDMEDLRERTAVVRGWVNKAIAHKDATGRDPPPLSDIHSCIDIIFELFNKYGQLIRGVTTGKDVVMPAAWPVVFRTEWIPEDQWPQIQSQIDRLDL